MTTESYLSRYVRSFFEDYLTCRRNLSPCTIRSYRDAIKLFILYATAQTRRSAPRLLVTDVKPPLVTSFLAHLEKERDNSIQTRNHRLVVLHRLFEYVASQEPALADHCGRILDIPPKRNRERPEITYLERNELAAMLEVMDTGTPLGRRDRALLLFMYNTGARVQEAADARVSWLSLQPPCKAQILGKGRKWRTCPLWDNVGEVLRQYLGERPTPPAGEEHLFLNRYGTPMSRFGIWNVIDRYKRRAAVTMPSLQAKRVTPHVIRHTTAMHLLQSGVEINVIRSWLGHVSLETTHQYVEIDMAMKRKALQACELSDGQTQGHQWRPAPDIVAWLKSL
jgi:site-specific recombinase XerD